MKEREYYADVMSFKKRSRLFWDSLFIVLFISVSVAFTYPEILFKRPQGVHVWRQTDCTSLALNYYQKDLPLLRPQMHHRFQGDSEAMGEFPIMYFLVGKLYSVFGYHEFIYRGIWWLISFAGSFCLYRLAYNLLNLPMESVLIGLILILSPVNAFYGISFIADPVAMYFVCIALYLLHQAYKSGIYYYYLPGIGIIALSGLLKISSLIIPISLISVFVLYCLLNRKWREFFFALTALFIIGFVNYSWYNYAIEFNRARNNFYFFTRTAPIWEIGSQERTELFKLFYDIRLQEFYNKLMWLVGIILGVLGFYKLRKNPWWTLFIFTGVVGVISFFLLFFQQFRYHDYYMINLVMIVPMLFLFGFRVIRDLNLNQKVVFVFKIFLIFLFVRDAVVTANFVKRRFRDPESSFFESRGYFDIEPYLNEVGVKKDDLVISVPDGSLNVSLYLMNRYGWTNLYHNPLKVNDIEDLKKEGAKFLIIGDEGNLQDTTLKNYLQDPVGKYGEISIFRL